MQNIYQADPKKIIVCMVGLPARGKSYMSKKIYRYLNWLGFKTQVFNIGNFRRKYCAQHNIQSKANFFSQQDKYYMELRQKIANITITQLIQFINKQDSKVVILDGTNSNNKRRQNVKNRLKNQMKCKYQLMWIQSVCNCQSIINQNIKEVKSHGLDYAQMSMEQAFDDFQTRIRHYQKYYQTLTQSSKLSYVKIINVGKGIQAHNISGYLPQKIMAYVINLKISPDRIIYLSRHGQSAYNQQNRIGGNPSLSQKGLKYAKALPKIFTQVLPQNEKQKIVLLTSTLKRTKQTVQMLKDLKINPVQPIQLRILDQLNAGICQQMTYKQIQQKYPQIYKDRYKDKLRFRYPSGQSYLDVIGRLQPLIYWIQRQNHPIVIFGHQAILRCIKAYFFNIQLQKIPYIEMPLHTIIRLTPQTYTFRTQHIVVNLQTQQIQSINKVSQKKYSIDRDGSNNDKK